MGIKSGVEAIRQAHEQGVDVWADLWLGESSSTTPQSAIADQVLSLVNLDESDPVVLGGMVLDAMKTLKLKQKDIAEITKMSPSRITRIIKAFRQSKHTSKSSNNDGDS